MRPTTAVRGRPRLPGIRPCLAIAAATVPLTVGAGGTGCAPSNAALRKIAQDEQIQLGTPERAGDWPYWPASLEFLPLSRSITTQAVSGRSLELYLECLDADGHGTRACGHLVLELNCPSAEPTTQRLTIDLTDATTNRQRWDEVTASYRLDVPAPFDRPPEVGTEIDCRAILFSKDGKTPTATTRVKW